MGRVDVRSRWREYFGDINFRDEKDSETSFLLMERVRVREGGTIKKMKNEKFTRLDGNPIEV